MDLLWFLKTGQSQVTDPDNDKAYQVGEDTPLPTNPGALDSTTDDVTIHTARGASTIPTHTGGSPMTALNANKTSDAIAVPAWANAICWNVINAADATNTGTVTASIVGSTDDSTYGVHTFKDTAAQSGLALTTAAGGVSRTTLGLPSYVKIMLTGTWTCPSVSVTYQFLVV